MLKLVDKNDSRPIKTGDILTDLKTDSLIVLDVSKEGVTAFLRVDQNHVRVRSTISPLLNTLGSAVNFGWKMLFR